MMAELSYTKSQLLGTAFKNNSLGAREILLVVREHLESLSSWDHETLKRELYILVEEYEINIGDFLILLRVACTGKRISPPLFESMEILGQECCLRRLVEAVGVVAGE